MFFDHLDLRRGLDRGGCDGHDRFHRLGLCDRDALRRARFSRDPCGCLSNGPFCHGSGDDRVLDRGGFGGTR